MFDVTLQGSYVTLARLTAAAHADDLWPRIGGEHAAPLWTYMGDGPYPDRATFEAAIKAKENASDQQFYAILDSQTRTALGYAAFLRNEPAHRTIEIGNIMFSPELQRTRGATEAICLMLRHVFEHLGYRRCEWKCNALNEPSRRAALRLGFTFEGIFRRHMLVKGLNRDTAWFSMLDSEWPSRGQGFERWLEPSNFSPDLTQKSRLSFSQ